METSPHVTGVIVADDDAMIRSVLRATFEALGLNVFLASDGLEAVQLASRIHAALIILDLKMPRLNGLLACRQIHQLPGNANTPIVILSFMQGPEAEAAAARVGATAYFLKPFRPALLMQALSRFLPINDAERDQIRHNAGLTNGIARSVSTPVAARTSSKFESDDLLDRGKVILGVLRG